MKYIDQISTRGGKNLKSSELSQLIKQYEGSLIMNEEAEDKFISMLKNKVEELNIAYPKSATLELNVTLNGSCVDCRPVNRNSDDDCVFWFRIKEFQMILK